MKKIIFISILIHILSGAAAQRGPLYGSGKVNSKTYEEKGFDKIELMYLPGKAIIEAGKPFSVKISIDDNLEKLLVVKTVDGILRIMFEGNEENKLYIENTNVVVRISLPAITSIEQRGNIMMVVKGIAGPAFRLENYGNGDAQLAGSTGKLEITKSGNGDVDAGGLVAQEARINTAGNGDIRVNAEKVFEVSASGNGDIKNTGAALTGPSSSNSGNGDIIDAAYQPKKSPYPPEQEDTRIKTRIQNNTGKWIELKVVYPAKGSYGIDIKAGGRHKEYFPLGTKIYRDEKTNTPLFEITPENRDTVLLVEN
jgi:Putative auto-transporter adhesin, head GIN domain